MAKVQVLWKGLFVRHFPRLQILGPQTTLFTVEQQFKILFWNLKKEIRPHEQRERKVRMKIEKLRGTTGFDGEVDKAWRKYDEFRQHYEKMSPPLQDFLNAQYAELWKEYANLDKLLVKLAGRDYDGTDESIGSKSKLGAVISYRNFFMQKFYSQKNFMTLVTFVTGKTNDENNKSGKGQSVGRRLLKWMIKKPTKWTFKA